MWDDKFVFVTSALFTFGMMIVIGMRRDAIKAGETPRFSNLLTRLIPLVTIIVGVGHFFIYGKFLDHKLSSILTSLNVGTMLAIFLGVLTGSFSSRFIRSLFNARFGSRDPLMGALVLLVLIIVYSLPVYQQELHELLQSVHLSSVDLPLAKFQFGDRAKTPGAIAPAAGKGIQQVFPTAIPRSSDPRPGLAALSAVAMPRQLPSSIENCDVSYVLLRDDCYIQFFATGKIDETAPHVLKDEHLKSTRDFLVPVADVADCLNRYIGIFPDAQLYVIDFSELLKWFFKLNGRARNDLPHSDTLSIQPEDIKNYNSAVNKVFDQVNQAFNGAEVPVKNCQISSVLTATSLSYLQPYTSIALANLLVAKGSPDKAVDVLTSWLDLWLCARGRGHVVPPQFSQLR